MSNEVELVDSSNQSTFGGVQLLTKPQKRQGCFDHIRLMLMKNYLIYRRQTGMTIFLLLSPIIICFVIIFWQAVINSFKNFLILNPPIDPLISQIPHCSGSSNCVSIGYFILGNDQPWIDEVMTDVAQSNQLQFGKDVKMLLKTKHSASIMDYLRQNQNLTQIAVVFCTDKWDLPAYSLSLPCSFDQLQPQQMVFYTILYNYTLLYKSPYLSDMRQAYPKDAMATKLKVSLDNAIIRKFTDAQVDSDGEYLTVYQQDYPRIPNRFIEGIDVAGNYGAFYFFAPYLLNFLMIINELLLEKGKKLRQGLVVMGLSHFSYWASWAITQAVLVASLTVIMLITGGLLGFDLFTKTPFLILFVLFFTFGYAIALVAFFISTVCPDVKNGYTIAYGFILTAMVMQMFFTQSAMTILFYRADSSEWVHMVRTFLSLYPAFKYSLIYADISQKSCKHYSLDENRWVDGVGYGYSDLFSQQQGQMTLEREVGYESPSAIANYFHLCLSCLFYVFLTYYFDHILSSNRGKSDSLLFFITTPIQRIRRLFHGGYNRTLPMHLNQEIHHSDYSDLGKKDTVKEERDKVLYNFEHEGNVDGLRVVGLTKTYHKYPFGYQSAEDVQALKEIYFELEQGELLALLGHNGAGKTTLINVLTGMYEATSGVGQVLNFNIHSSMDQIRKVMGVCPQFDILWNQLTAAEHLRMYASIKGVPLQQIEKEVDDRLKDVDLGHVKNAQISTFSVNQRLITYKQGGMKRRVSLAISAIGDPKVIILDEPTTGMDPKARRQVWEMIKNMKQGRVVLLTTHAMEEADALADRIAVMADGNLKCIGTSLYLKNNFSEGYRLNVICDNEKKEKTAEQLLKLINKSNLLDKSGGSIVLSISFAEIGGLKPFFEIVENNEMQVRQDDEEEKSSDRISLQEKLELKQNIKDWGLSHATLEEVFMKVTKKCE